MNEERKYLCPVGAKPSKVSRWDSGVEEAICISDYRKGEAAKTEEEFDEADFYFGSQVGFRSWTVLSEPDSSYHNFGEIKEDYASAPCSEEDCHCGFNAWYGYYQAISYIRGYCGVNKMVTGAIVGAGRTRNHERGFRCEKAQIIGLIDNQEMADIYGVPNFDSIKELSEFILNQKKLSLKGDQVKELRQCRAMKGYDDNFIPSIEEINYELAQGPTGILITREAIEEGNLDLLSMLMSITDSHWNRIRFSYLQQQALGWLDKNQKFLEINNLAIIPKVISARESFEKNAIEINFYFQLSDKDGDKVLFSDKAREFLRPLQMYGGRTTI